MTFHIAIMLIIVAFIGGGTIGIFIMGALVMSREEDVIFVSGVGECTVPDIDIGGSHPISVFVSVNGERRYFSKDGVRIGETLQTAFWSDPQIVAPPRPKRFKKVKMGVRPYMTRYNPGKMVLASEHEQHMDLPWCGPVQVVEVEIEDD